ncbi:MAG: type II toxin-antitoxin system PemK/MazF family toxin [Deltaproteobacteria bacterium]|nr:type II toxin-antitoxin system PemK/MazF family toxin [Deltaproteobacteria bacterium]
MKRGDVFLVNFDPTVGAEARKTRPALGVSNDINNASHCFYYAWRTRQATLQPV